jgi:cysteine desulfurase family protein (TIGR01976 family)
LTLDIPYVRAHFPALSDEWALMDNAGGSPPLFGVIEAVHDYMRYRQVNLGASYGPSADATARVAAGTAAMAQLIGCDPEEVVLGPSSTMLVRLLASALAHAFEAGDEVVVTNLDHESNIAPWRELEERGVVVREWKFDPRTGDLTPAGLERVLGTRTRLVAFTHVSNLYGTVHDAAALVRKIHMAGALAVVDGVAFAPHRRVDVRAIGADFYFLSLYKLSGPHEGLLYARRDRLRQTRSLAFPFLGNDLGPYRLQPGNVNHELTASLPALLRYYVELGERHGGGGLDRAFAVIEEHVARLGQPVLDFLSGRSGVKLLGRSRMGADRVPTISFTVDGRDSAEIVRALDAHRVGTRFGHFYSYRAAEALGILEQNGVVRVSLFHGNTPTEVDRLLDALASIL